MRSDISNKALTGLLALAVTISMFGLVVYLTGSGDKITGAATSPVALARINITAKASINWTVNSVDWGTGLVNETAQYCVLNTEGENNAANCSLFNTVTEGLRLENDGNRRVAVNFSVNASATQFIGGTNPAFEWKLANNETNACGDPGPGNTCSANASALQYQGTYSTVSTASVEICPCFDFKNPSDTINTELQIRIPTDSLTGIREATITAVATVI